MYTIPSLEDFICDDHFIVQVLSEHVDELMRNENFERTIANFDANFSRLLLELLERIMEFTTSDVEVKLLSILHR